MSKTSKTSKTSTLYPIVAAVLKSDDILGTNRTWQAQNSSQGKFLEIYNKTKADITRIPEIRSVASYSADSINSFLKSEGFGIEMSPFSPPDFGVASVMKVALQWVKEGKVRNSAGYRNTYLTEGVRFYRSGTENLIVHLDTKTGDHVYLYMCSCPDSLFQAGCSLTPGAQDHTYEGLYFPQVDIDVRPDISWLSGMSTMGDSGTPAYITQALQQTKFKMDEKGATVESAVALQCKNFSARAHAQPYVIDSPFLVVIRRDGLSMPLFIGYMDKDSWKKGSQVDAGCSERGKKIRS